MHDGADGGHNKVPAGEGFEIRPANTQSKQLTLELIKDWMVLLFSPHSSFRVLSF